MTGTEKNFGEALSDFLTIGHQLEDVDNGYHDHGKDRDHIHEHQRGREPHHHDRRHGKTYFKHERRSDGMPVRCEGHWSIELDVEEDWCYRS